MGDCEARFICLQNVSLPAYVYRFSGRQDLKAVSNSLTSLGYVRVDPEVLVLLQTVVYCTVPNLLFLVICMLSSLSYASVI